MVNHFEEVTVDGRPLRLSNLDKVLYPDARLTKAEVIDYYRCVSDTLLPHLKGRPVTLKRYPDGVSGPYFYEKQCPPYCPPWMRTANVGSDGQARRIHYCQIDNLASLIWAVNLADLELHTFLSRTPDFARPTFLVFDLDPGAPAGVLECAEVALRLKDLLGKTHLESWVKSSGSKGLQVYVPLNSPVDYDATKAFAHAAANVLAHRHPDLIVSNMRKTLRTGRVLIDWSQNDAHKTTVCVYSLRATTRPRVSVPLEWPEIRNAVRRHDPDRLMLEYDQVLRRIRRRGDLFGPVLTRHQELPGPGVLQDAMPR
ncbi:MAG: non-homologous end-joining DNA ligase [Acidiferrobacteraceae bacterium]